MVDVKQKAIGMMAQKMGDLGLLEDNPAQGGGGGGIAGFGGGNKYSGRMGKMNYMQQRTNEVFGGGGGSRYQQYGGGNRYPSQQQRYGSGNPGEEQFDQQEQQMNEQNMSVEAKLQQLPGHGATVSGTYGPAASAGSSLKKLALEDAKITEEDVKLLKSIIVDKTTGHAMKVDEQGNVVALTPQERERMAFIVIELCLFILAKQVKGLSQHALETYRQKISENLGEKDEDLLPLLKVANTIANKLMQGSMKSKRVEDYIKALARTNNPGDIEMARDDDEQQE